MLLGVMCVSMMTRINKHITTVFIYDPLVGFVSTHFLNQCCSITIAVRTMMD